ncbi:MAG: beta-N-acetylhexosaminidase [Pseudohongiellaceae bacterium]
MNTGYGVLMLDVAGLSLQPEELDQLRRPSVGGVILFSRNFASRSQLRELVGEIRSCNDRLLIAVDQEGGRVQRFRSEEFTTLPAMHHFGRLYGNDRQAALDLATRCGWLLAAELLSCGIDFSFAPVLDTYNTHSAVIGDRAFCAEPAVIAELARALIDGMHEAGMAATGKHFPGHGGIAADSHLEIPVDHRSLQELQAVDMIPFQQCADILDAVMPAHVIYPAVDARCAGFSRIWLQDILRDQLGFRGIIFSDDLTMAGAASAGGIEQRAENALAAGCDMILVCNKRELAITAADWLESRENSLNVLTSDRLATMAGRTRLSYSKLITSERWQQSREALAQI